MPQNDMKPNDSSSEEEETSGSEEEGQTSGSESDEVSDTDSGEKPKQEPAKAITGPSKSVNNPQAPDLSESGESGSDSDSDSDLPPKKSDVVDSNVKPKQEPTKSLVVSDISDSGESDTDSGSDSDLPPKKSTVVDANVKPISSKPMERVEVKLVKKDGSKSVSTPPPPAKSKRPPPAPAANENDAKKAKQSTANVEPKKSIISRSTEPEESDSDTDSDLPPKKLPVVDANVKPMSSKPMESKSAKKPPPAKSKPSPATLAPADLKKGKKNAATDDDSKKQLFQRLWSEDDEIAILEGMIAYKNERNGENPSADMGEFHEFIKNSLHVDVSRAQLMDKVRRLKKKYVNNASREKDGKDRSFSKSHEQKGYELSKLIWGGNSNSNSNSNTEKIGTESKKSQSQKCGNSKGKPNGVADKQKSVMEVEKKIDVSRFVKYGGMSDSPVLAEEIVKAGMELVDGAKRAELDLKWKKLKEEELVLYVKRMELLKEQALVVLEAVNSSGN